MNLADVLAGPSTAVRSLYSAKVTAVATGSVTVMVAGSAQSARYIGAKPTVGQMVLVAFVADAPVCLGVFGTT